MKKKLLLIMLLLFPFYVKALSISGASLVGDDKKYSGSNLYLTVRMNTEQEDITSGVYSVIYEVEFDESKLEIIDAQDSTTWENTLYKEDGKYYVYSEISLNAKQGLCLDSATFCGTYETRIMFTIKDDVEGKTEVKIPQLGVIAIEYSIEGDDLIASTIPVEYNKQFSKTITIEKSTTEIEKPTIKPNIETKPEVKSANEVSSEVNSKKNEIKKNIEGKKEEQEEKNIIDNIKIEGYELKFSPIVYSYDLELPTDVNSIKVDVNKSNDNKVEIIGNENIKENDNKVFVDVTDISGNTTRYTINIKYSKVDNEIETIKNVKKFYEKNKKIIFISLGVIGFIILVVIIVNTIKDKKLDDEFNKL